MYDGQNPSMGYIYQEKEGSIIDRPVSGKFSSKCSEKYVPKYVPECGQKGGSNPIWAMPK